MSANLTLRTLTGGTSNTTKNAPLTNAEMDQNLINLDNEIDTKVSTVELQTAIANNDPIPMAIALG